MYPQLTRIARTAFRPIPSFSRAYTSAGTAALNKKAKNSNGHEKNPDNVARGLKAAIHNPNVSSGAKDHATKQLKEMNRAHKEAEKLAEGQHVYRQLGYKAALKNKKTTPEVKKKLQTILGNFARGPGEVSKNEKRVIGGYKATLKNSHTSVEAKDQAKKMLKERGAL